MNILVSNDDGIDAPGLAALEAALAPLGTVWTVAPEKEQSAQSHALTMHKPLRAIPAGERRWGVSGTPADCVYLALHHLINEPVDIVVSGINRGANLGSDVHYSGTVAAAREGCLAGIRAVAVSLDRDPTVAPHWETAAQLARQVVAEVAQRTLDPLVYLNLNVPDVPAAKVRGIQVASVLRRAYVPMVEVRVDPRHKQYFWIGGPLEDATPAEGTDEAAVRAGYASLSALTANVTASSTLEALRGWFR